MSSSTDPPAFPPLAAEFPRADQSDWDALVHATLKGAPAAGLTTYGVGGLETRPLYTAASAAGHLAEARFNAVRSQGPGRWDVRAIQDHPDPATASAQALSDLEAGANSLLLRIDPTGARGVAIGSADDLARTLARVELDLAPVALDAGWRGVQAAQWLHTLARSAPRAKLALHLDPVGVFAESGVSPGPVAAHIAQAAQLAARLAPIYPQASLFLASGRAAYEAGGDEGLELGLMAASAVAYANAMLAVGLETRDALGRIVIGLSADAEYFTTLAKHRAARAIWARLGAAFGADVPARIEARSGRRGLSRLDPWVNLLRLTSGAFGAALGGADSLVLEPFTQPLTQHAGRATAFARRQARNIQLVLMEESHLARVEDPAGGSGFLEAQTDQLARAGWNVLQQIEQRGGVIAALQDGFIATVAGQARAAREADLQAGRAALIGTSVYRNPREAAVETREVDAGIHRRIVPDMRPPGPDSRCPALEPWRAAQPFETQALAEKALAEGVEA